MFAQLTLAAAAIFGTQIETPDYARVADLVRSVPGRVLYVSDLDRTLLTSESDLTGEHWYKWQASEIAAASPGAVARSETELLRIHSWIYAVSQMRAVEPMMPQTVREFAKQGISTLVLTSRGPEMRDSAQRELKRNGFDFDLAAPGPGRGYVVQYEPAAGSPVQYEKGVLFTQGQDKGKMLISLLDRLQERYDSIVFVDDRASHVENVQRAFVNRPEQVYTVLYTHELPHVQAFQASNKKAVKAAWCTFADGLHSSLYKGAAVESLPFIPCSNP